MALFAFLLSAALLQKPALPTYDLIDVEGHLGFVAKVGGKEKTLVFASRWSASGLLGGDAEPRSVQVEGRELIKIGLPPTAKVYLPEGADGALGTDALRRLCLGFNALYPRMEVFPDQKIGIEGAKAYFAALPAWGGPSRIVRLPVERASDGTPIIATTVDGRKTTLLLAISTYNSSVDETVGWPKGSKAESWAFLPSVRFPGLASRWIRTGLDDDWDAEDEGAHGMVALDAFLSRRVVVDLADDAVYVEELPEAARLSMFLSTAMGMPLAVDGDEARLAPLPGLVEDAGPLSGSRLLKIADIPVAEWLKDLRRGDSEAVERLNARFRRFEDDFDVTILGPTGEQRKITVPRRARPTDASLGGPGEWLRADARARAASRSRSGRSAFVR